MVYTCISVVRRSQFFKTCQYEYVWSLDNNDLLFPSLRTVHRFCVIKFIGSRKHLNKVSCKTPSLDVYQDHLSAGIKFSTYYKKFILLLQKSSSKHYFNNRISFFYLYFYELCFKCTKH